MSWSFHALGKPMAVLQKARKDLHYPCAEPEESIKQKFLNILEVSLISFPEVSAIKVVASGSQSSAYDTEGKSVPDRFINSLSITIEPVWGFVE